MSFSLNVATYNVHKGFSSFNRRLVLHQVREALQRLNVDLVFLQETQGEHRRHAAKLADYPIGNHSEFLAESTWAHVCYGKNRSYRIGHHGNAVLSRYPIQHSHNLDISAHRFEGRGLLHTVLQLPHGQEIHALCTHLGLFSRGRNKQASWLIDYIKQSIPEHAAVLLAGDFNDWQNRISVQLEASLGLQEVFSTLHGQVARSFPAYFPLLQLDRIYMRGFKVSHAEVLYKDGWQKLSDHAPLVAHLELCDGG